LYWIGKIMESATCADVASSFVLFSYNPLIIIIMIIIIIMPYMKYAFG